MERIYRKGFGEWRKSWTAELFSSLCSLTRSLPLISPFGPTFICSSSVSSVRSVVNSAGFGFKQF